MENKLKLITFIVGFSGILLLSAAYVNHFQSWLIFNNTLNSSTSVQTINVSGLHSIVYSDNSVINELRAYEPEKKSNVVKEDVSILTSSSQYIDLKNDLKNYRPFNLTGNTKSSPSLTNDDEFESFNRTEVGLELPLIVELENEVLIEFPASYQKADIQKVLARLLVMPNSLDVKEAIQSNAINTQVKPYLYGRALNEYKKTIRYPAQAFRYAEFVINNYGQMVLEDDKEYALFSIPLVERKVRSPFENYQAWVHKYSKQYGVEPELVFAIMEVESAFNPKAVSRSNALGLMQIKADAAGKDVYSRVDGKEGKPSRKELLDAQENIRIGVAYLGLLKNFYFKDIKNPKKQEMMMISSYNGGLSKALGIFNKKTEYALKEVNSLSDRGVYRKLAYEHSSKETRDYIKKVHKAKMKYIELLG